MSNQRVACSGVLALLLPATLGLSCVERDWSLCSPQDECQAGYTCTADWKCVRNVDGGADGFVAVDGYGMPDSAGGGPDGPAPAGTGGFVGGAAGPDAAGSPGSALADAAVSTPGLDAFGGAGGSGGGADVAPDVPVAPPDAPSLLAVGAACSVGSDCAGGNCADGVCCAAPCSGCNACSHTLTTKDDGVCAPVSSGQDPHNACTDETAAKPCGNDGTCDGAGACRKVVSNSKICTPAACSTDKKTFTPAATCDGAGACPAAKTQDCGAFQCALTGCLKTCASQTDCDTTTSYCDPGTKTCAAKLSNGSAASQGFQCTSGIVADGVCCNQDCTGCSACTSGLNGQASTTTGQCLPVVAGKAAPHNFCTANPPCGFDGTCDGASSCQYAAKGTPCGSTCTGSTLTSNACDGKGTCGPGTSQTCANFSACDGNTCGTKKVLGAACSGPSDCASGYCADNLAGTSKICCSLACSTCQGCNSNGSGCTNKNTGAADSACGTTAASCQNGTCNSAGACTITDGAACGVASCTAGFLTPAPSCNSSGQCVAGVPTACASGACSSSTACAALKANGLTCSVGTECASGYCTNGVCCNVSSCGTCQACNLNGTGTCSPVAQGTADPACPASTANCTYGGCNGSGGCQPSPSGTACGTVCINDESNGVIAGQWYTPSTIRNKKCNGTTAGAAGCVTDNSGSAPYCGVAGSPGLVCASPTACKTSCFVDSDCAYAYYCNAGTCTSKGGTSCSSAIQCLNGACTGSFVQPEPHCSPCALSSNTCPITAPGCQLAVGAVGCVACNPSYESCNSDGSNNCTAPGFTCPSNAPDCGADNHCHCGATGAQCPYAGQICVSGQCKMGGGWPCVNSTDCAYGSCTNGVCPSTPSGGLCTALLIASECTSGDCNFSYKCP